MSGTPVRITLRLLGPLQIEHDGDPIRKIGSQKSLALLGYLVQQGQPLSRTTLAGLLWPDQEEAEARRNLRWALNNLTNLLPGCFVADRHTIHFQPVDHLWIDLLAFAALATQNEEGALRTAADLYRGEFLAGLTADDAPELDLWLLQARERWQGQALHLLERVSQGYLDAGAYPQAENTLHRLLELQPWHEAAHRHLLRLLATTGRRSAALAYYERCRQLLATELAADPMPETVALYEQIRDDKLDKMTVQASTHPVILSSLHPVTDWGEAPAAGAFYGREGELAQLTEWLTMAAARLVGIFGMGGMGKTTLAATVARAVAERFDYVIWRSLLNAPLLSDILHTWVDRLTDHKLTAWPERLDEQLRLLLTQVQQKRCLLVLDNFESLLQERARSGAYRPGYEGYGQLIAQMGTTHHQSCLLITSSEQPPELTQLAGAQTPVFLLALAGLDLNAGRTLLGERGVSGTVAGEVALVMRTSGNPLALKLVAETIRDLFTGDITQFLADESLIFDDIRTVLAEQFARLSRLEQDLLLWLAMERTAVTAQALQENLLPPVPKRDFLEALRALQRRSLLEKGADGFTLQNVVIEFATGYLIDTITQEIINERPDRLQSHALLKAGAPEYLRQSQARLLLLPIIEQLTAQIAESGLRGKVQRLLDQLRQVGAEARYAGGNLLNLLVQAEVPLAGLDFSALPIRQAYLRQVELTGVNFRNAALAQVAFADTFGLVHAVAFNPDGQTLAAAADHAIRFWRDRDGQPDLILRGHTDDVWAVAFSPDGEWLVSGRLVHTLHGHAKGVVSVAFSPDGRTLASGGYDQTIRLWDAATGACLHCLEQHREWVWGVTFSPDGGLLASASGDRTIRLWQVKTGDCLAVLEGHTDQVWSVAFSPDGRWLASGSNDQTVRVWDMRTRQTVQVLQGHSGWVRSVTFAPGGDLLISGSNDGTVRLWRVDGGQALHVLRGHRNAVNTVACGPAGRVVASGSNDQTVRLWDLMSGRPLDVFNGYTNWVRTVAFTPDGRHLVSGSDDGATRLWAIAEGALVQTFTGHSQMVRAVSISPDGRLLATASADRTVRLWQIDSGKLLHLLRGHTNWVSAVAFSADGRLLATSGWDETVQLWSVASGELLHTLRGHQRAVYTVAFLPNQPDGRYRVVSGSSDRTIRVWDGATGAPVATLTGHSDVVRALACSNNGRLLVSGDEAGAVHLWTVTDEGDGATVHAVGTGHTKGVRSVAFSADGRFALSGSDDQTVRIWPSATGELVQTLQGHTNVVWGVAASPDGQTIASGSGDETIRLWRLAADGTTATCTRLLTTPGPYADLDITGATGLTTAQKETLKALGAIEAEPGVTATTASAQVVAPPPRPNNLPRQSMPLIGRQSELSHLTALLTDEKRSLLTLLGPGGVGKTSLALAVAQVILDFEQEGSLVNPKSKIQNLSWQDPKFSDGVWFVPLAGLAGSAEGQTEQLAAETLEDTLAAAIAAAIGMPPVGDFGERSTLKEQLRTYLRSKQLLLVLDNFEHLLAGAWLVSDLLTQAPGVQIIVTSRTPLNLQEEWRFPVHPLRQPILAEDAATVDPATLLGYASVAFFVQCAQRIHYDFHLDQANWRAIVAICRAVDGLPLALQLAATWLEGMSCQEIAEMLQGEAERGLDFLTTTVRNVPPRHQRLRTVFDASWRLLTDQEQQGAAQLAVFRGGCERAAVLAVTTLRLPALNSLIAKSIVQRDEAGRLSMHELLRQYAAERLAAQQAAPQEMARTSQERHSRYYLTLLATLEPPGQQPPTTENREGALAQWQRDLDNFRQAWRWAVAQPDDELLSQSLAGYVRLYGLLGLFAEGVTILADMAALLQADALTAARSVTRRRLVGRLLVEQATFLNSQARYDEAVTTIEGALAWLPTEQEPWQVAGAYLRWGEARWYQGDLVGAQPLLAQAHQCIQQAPSPASRELSEIHIDLLCALGGIAVRQGDYGAATTHYEAGLTLSRQLDDGRRLSRLLHSLGTLRRNQAHYPAAHDYLEQGLRLAQQMQDRHGEGRARNSLGDIALYLGDYLTAHTHYAAGLDIARRTGDRRSECIALTNLGLVARDLGQFDKGRALIEEAIALAQAIGFARGEGWGWCCLSLLHSQRQAYDASLTAAQRALDLFNQLADRLGQAYAQTNRGRALTGQGAWSAASAAYEEALHLRRTLQQPHLAIEVTGGLAQVALAEQQLHTALTYVEEILRYLDTHTFAGLEQPGQLYYICYAVLAAIQDRRDAALLVRARQFLNDRAARLDDDRLQQTFLHHIPAHAALMQQG